MDAAVVFPQTIGELLDRAVRVYVRAFVRFFIPLAIVAGVLLAFDTILDPEPRIGVLGSVLLRLTEESTAQHRAVSFGTQVAKAAASFVAVALEVNVAAILMRGLLAGAMPPLGAAFRRGVSRMFVTIGVSLLYVLVAIPIVLGLFIVVGIPIALIVRFVTVGTTVIWPLLYIVALGAIVVPVALVQLAWFQSAIAVATESDGALAAFDAGWSNTFFRAGIRRSLGAGLAILVVGSGAKFAGDTIGSLVGLIPGLALAGNIPPTITDIVAYGLETVFVVYYRQDVRVRREGSAAAPYPSPT